jgi:hypothetical protein
MGVLFSGVDLPRTNHGLRLSLTVYFSTVDPPRTGPRTFRVHQSALSYCFLVRGLAGRNRSGVDLPRTRNSAVGNQEMSTTLLGGPSAYSLPRAAVEDSHKYGREPAPRKDLSRTGLWTFHVRDMDLPRTNSGPSAYIHRTFRVPLNRKQEMHVVSREACDSQVVIDSEKWITTGEKLRQKPS